MAVPLTTGAVVAAPASHTPREMWSEVTSDETSVPVPGSGVAPAPVSVGSRWHVEGKCKPCAFYYTKGCLDGEQCVFCHLCPPREKKRRERVKRQLQRSILTSMGRQCNSAEHARQPCTEPADQSSIQACWGYLPANAECPWPFSRGAVPTPLDFSHSRQSSDASGAVPAMSEGGKVSRHARQLSNASTTATLGFSHSRQSSIASSTSDGGATVGLDAVGPSIPAMPPGNWGMGTCRGESGTGPGPADHRPAACADAVASGPPPKRPGLCEASLGSDFPESELLRNLVVRNTFLEIESPGEAADALPRRSYSAPALR